MKIRSDSIANLAAALAKAHATFPPLTKNRSVTVRPREGAPYSFDYATLDHIMDSIRGPLAAHGLAILHTLDAQDGGALVVETVLVHASGEFLGVAIPAKADRPGNQALGSALTYARRYGVTALLGLAADDDDDGNAADGHQVERRQDRQPAPRQAQAPQAQAPKAQDGAAAPKARWDAALAILVAAIGQDEAIHQAEALKAKHGPAKLAALAELEEMASHHRKAGG